MTDSEKVKLIHKLIQDFWDYNSDDEIKAGAMVLVSSISTVLEFGEAEDGKT